MYFKFLKNIQVTAVYFVFINNSFILPEKSVVIFKLETGSEENYQYPLTF